MKIDDLIPGKTILTKEVDGKVKKVIYISKGGSVLIQHEFITVVYGLLLGSDNELIEILDIDGWAISALDETIAVDVFDNAISKLRSVLLVLHVFTGETTSTCISEYINNINEAVTLNNLLTYFLRPIVTRESCELIRQAIVHGVDVKHSDNYFLTCELNLTVNGLFVERYINNFGLLPDDLVSLNPIKLTPIELTAFWNNDYLGYDLRPKLEYSEPPKQSTAMDESLFKHATVTINDQVITLGILNGPTILLDTSEEIVKKAILENIGQVIVDNKLTEVCYPTPLIGVEDNQVAFAAALTWAIAGQLIALGKLATLSKMVRPVIRGGVMTSEDVIFLKFIDVNQMT